MPIRFNIRSLNRFTFIFTILSVSLFLIFQTDFASAQGPADGDPPVQSTNGPIGPTYAVEAPTGVPLGTAFTYQGQLKKDGGPFNGDCNFQFRLWDAATAGSQKGGNQDLTGIGITDGLFAVQLDFGDQFRGEARWLETAVQCGGDAGFTTLQPRTALSATPYALGLRPGAHIEGQVPAGNSFEAGLKVVNTSPNYPIGLYGVASASTGLAIGVAGNNSSPDGFAIYGATFNGGTAVRGEVIDDGFGVWGSSPTSIGVFGDSQSNVGVFGRSATLDGVSGLSNGNGRGVRGESKGSGVGVWGQSVGGNGVRGFSSNQVGVYGESANFDGTWGVANASGKAGVVAIAKGTNGIGLLAKATGTNGIAGVFEGRLRSTIVEITGGSDLAERFDVSDLVEPEPGTLLVIDENYPGKLKSSSQPYDTKVAGVVSGAGGVQPGLTLHQAGVVEGDQIVAIAGRVYVKAEAFSGAIQPGDLLTTSSIPGHAMKAANHDRAYGAVIGKAMTGLDQGTGLVLVLVNLQ